MNGNEIVVRYGSNNIAYCGLGNACMATADKLVLMLWLNRQKEKHLIIF